MGNGRGNSAKRDARDADRAERMREALALRKGGANLEQIGRQLGCNKSTAYRLIADAIAAIPKEAAADVLALELQRLDTMQAAIWPRVVKGELQAHETQLRIMRRRAEYLGLDAPKKQELSGPDGGPIELAAAAERVRGRLDRLAAIAGAGATPPGDRSD